MKIWFIGLISAGYIATTWTYDTPHYYLPTSFFTFGRIERDWLSSVDVTIESGHAHKAYNANGRRTSLLLDCHIPTEIHTDFSILSTILTWTQNCANGLFFQANLPIKTYTFLINSPFLLPEPYKTIIKKNKQCLNPCTQSGIGDVTALIGLTQNYNNTAQADFFDYTLQCGILLPTGKKQNPYKIGSIPLGYNGKTALLATITGSIGYFEWLTIGLFGESIFFVTQKPTGPLIHVAGYMIADHFIRGLSFGFSPSFVDQFGTNQRPLKNELPNQTDQPWNALVLHFFAEYEFTQPDWIIGPRIGMGYHLVTKGKNAFDTKTSTINLGLDLVW